MSWAEVPAATARALHDAYTATVTDRIARFGMHMGQSGLALGDLDWTSLDAFDDLWFWAQDHLSMFDHPHMRFADEPTGWHPHLGDTPVPEACPSWSGCPDLSIEAHEFSSGVAALLAQFAIDQWSARWIFDGNRSMLEVPRTFEHPSAMFGPVVFSPETVVARAVRTFYRHPLWHQPAPWHALAERLRRTPNSWAHLDDERAQRFHDDFVGGHLRRLSQFREWLLPRGLDTTAMRFDDTSDIDAIWAWAKDNITFAEQMTLPRAEHRTWYPTLSQNAADPIGLPRWSDVTLSTETLEFASGLAACATEVALRSWGADWSLGGRPGDARGVNRPHLRIERGGASEWLDIERDTMGWLATAVVRAKRPTPAGRVWSGALGGPAVLGREPIILAGEMFAVPTPPWASWRARYADRLLPGLPAPAPDRTEIAAIDERRLAPQPAAVPMAFTDAATRPTALAALDLRLEPDDIQGDRFWTVEVAETLAAESPHLVERFTSRLNRSRGVASAALLDPCTLTLRMTRFGAPDMEAVEAIVLRVWEQTKATHREPATA